MDKDDDNLIKSVLQKCKNSLSEKLYIIESNNINSVLVALKKKKKKKKYFIPSLKKLVSIWLWLQHQTFFQLKAVDGT